jgi:hypothetical protein
MQTGNQGRVNAHTPIIATRKRLTPNWEVYPFLRNALYYRGLSTSQPPQVSVDSINPVYFETHFKRQKSWEDWPHKFAIITAYATTGEAWTDSENEAADKKLEAELRQQGSWLQRLTGYSPVTGHAEPGWAVDLSFEAACDLGGRFRQDALYYVVGDVLYVSFCDQRRAQVLVGLFRSRVHLTQLPFPGLS